MSKSNTWLVVPDANWNDPLPSMIGQRWQNNLGLSEVMTWNEFANHPINIRNNGAVIDFVCKFDNNLYHIVEFEAFTTTGEREQINHLRGEREQTDPSWAIVSNSELKSMIVIYSQ